MPLKTPVLPFHTKWHYQCIRIHKSHQSKSHQTIKRKSTVNESSEVLIESAVESQQRFFCEVITYNRWIRQRCCQSKEIWHNFWWQHPHIVRDSTSFGHSVNFFQWSQSFCEVILLSHSVKAFCEIILYVGSFDGFLGNAVGWGF